MKVGFELVQGRSASPNESDIELFLAFTADPGTFYVAPATWRRWWSAPPASDRVDPPVRRVLEAETSQAGPGAADPTQVRSRPAARMEP